MKLFGILSLAAAKVSATFSYREVAELYWANEELPVDDQRGLQVK